MIHPDLRRGLARGRGRACCYVIGRYDVREAASSGERGVAVSSGDIKDALVAAQIDSLAESLADDLQRRADNGIVARGPRRLLTGLD